MASARADAGELCAGTIDSWVLWNLTGGAVHACDATNASRTQLFNLRRRRLGSTSCSRCSRFPRRILPEIRPSSGVFGDTTRRSLAWPTGCPIASLIGDSHAALFGHAAFEPGMVKATYGTGSSLMTLTPAPRPLALTVCRRPSRGPCRAERRTRSRATSPITGGAIDWFGQFLGGANTRRDGRGSRRDRRRHRRRLSRAGIRRTRRAALGRSRARSDLRASRAARPRRTSRARRVESIAYQVRDVFDAMRSRHVADAPSRSWPTAAPAATTR